MRGSRGLAIAALLAVGASARSSSAEPDVRARYVGASFAAQAGVGLNDYFPWMLGADVFAGVRVTPSLSIEGFFASRFGASSTGFPVPCSGASDQWRAEVFGARVWLHLEHLRAIDLSFAPTIAGGLWVDKTRATTSYPFPCEIVDTTTQGWALDVGVAFGVELRPTPWFGVRVTMEMSLDLLESRAGYLSGAISLDGWIGPLLRF